MSRVHVDETQPYLTPVEREARDRYLRLLEGIQNIEIVPPDLIARYRELRGAC